MLGKQNCHDSGRWINKGDQLIALVNLTSGITVGKVYEAYHNELGTITREVPGHVIVENDKGQELAYSTTYFAHL